MYKQHTHTNAAGESVLIFAKTCTPISDHLPVYVELKLKLPKPPPFYISTRSYKHYNPDLFTADLATKSDKFLSIFSEEDINYKLTTFKRESL